MTKEQVVALTKRVAQRIARGNIVSSPISEAERRRIEELRRQQSAKEKKKEHAALTALRPAGHRAG